MNIRRSIRKKLLEILRGRMSEEEDLDDYLKEMDYRAYAAVDRTGLLETPY